MRRTIIPGCRGFTLVEALVAVALGVIVLGGTTVMYYSGNRAFVTVTEHSSFREEALLLLERIERDLRGLIVSDQLDPKRGLYYMVQPYELFDPRPQQGINPRTRLPEVYQIPAGLRFFRYHHMQSITGATGPTAQLVGHQIEYKVEPIGNGEKGVNLLRNGRRANKMPLSAILFEVADPVYAARAVGAAPNAILNVTVVPRGGLWGSMTPDTVRRLRDDGKVVTRSIHLVAYESQFTLLLWLATVKQQARQELDPLEQAVFAAGEKLPALLRGRLQKKIEEMTNIGYRLDENRVVLEPKAFDDATAGKDPAFQNAKEEVQFDASTVLGSIDRKRPNTKYGVSARFDGIDLTGM
jgi:prepilin-type N-terminal cleavage/methylation domain-containing protein